MNENKLLTFIPQIPLLCGADNAARRGQDFLSAFKMELADPKSVYARNAEDGKDPYNRFYALRDMPVPEDMVGKKQHILALLIICDIAHEEITDGVSVNTDLKNKLITEAKLNDGVYTDVDALYTVEDAARGFWKD